jgi:aminoglycoside phosphotransferase (APT) family kinase protein
MSRSSFQPLSTAVELLAAARSHGLVLTADQPELDGTGLDFLVLHARDESGVPWIVRTPRRQVVLDSAHVEARVLGLVRPALPVAVPDWRVFGDTIIAYPRLDGTPAVTVEGGAPTWHHVAPGNLPEAFLASFAKALCALLAIPAEVASRAGVPRQTVAEAREQLRIQMLATREALAPGPRTWARWQRWLENDALWPAESKMVHGDLHPGHLLLDAEATLVGILDWTEAKVTDPSFDLAMFFGCFGGDALERLAPHLRAHGAPLAHGWEQHAKERWAAFPIVGADWALRTENQAILDYARHQLAEAEAGEEA